MAGNHKTGDGLSKLKKNNASVPEKLDNSVGTSSESISPTGKKGVHTIIHMKSLNEDEDAEDFDPVREGLIIKAVDKFLRKMQTRFLMVKKALVFFHRTMKHAKRRCCKRLSIEMKENP